VTYRPLRRNWRHTNDTCMVGPSSAGLRDRECQDHVCAPCGALYWTWSRMSPDTVGTWTVSGLNKENVTLSEINQNKRKQQGILCKMLCSLVYISIVTVLTDSTYTELPIIRTQSNYVSLQHIRNFYQIVSALFICKMLSKWLPWKTHGDNFDKILHIKNSSDNLVWFTAHEITEQN